MKQVLSIRISGRERKRKAIKVLLDCLHFENMLIILVRKFYEKYQRGLLNISILRGLFSKKYEGKYLVEFQKVVELIREDSDLNELYRKLQEQWDKISNSGLLVLIIRKVVKNFENYFKALKSYKVNSEKFNGIPKPPKPKKLKWVERYSIEFVTKLGVVKQGEGYVLLKLKAGKERKFLKVKLPEWFNYQVSSARLKMIGEDIWVDLVYEYPIEKIEAKGEYKAGIDLGLDELVSVVSENSEVRSFIISGREIKAFNQWYNKRKAELQSEIDKGNKEKIIELKRLSSYRKRYLDTLFHQIAKRLVVFLYETGHKVIYIGKNCIESKNGINLGKKINQEFVSVPFRKLVDYIKYKAEKLGMEVVEIDESYTSKTSPFADVLNLKETRDFQGKRIGNLFKDFVTGKVFHADLVGALNILRKGAELLKLSWYDNLKVVFKKLCNPKRFKLWDWVYQKVFPELLLSGVGGSGARDYSLAEVTFA